MSDQKTISADDTLLSVGIGVASIGIPFANYAAIAHDQPALFATTGCFMVSPIMALAKEKFQFNFKAAALGVAMTAGVVAGSLHILDKQAERLGLSDTEISLTHP